MLIRNRKGPSGAKAVASAMLLVALTISGGSAAQNGTPRANATPNGQIVAPPSSYADVADQAVGAATIVHARVRRVRVVEDARAANVPANLVRLYIEAETRAMIFGSDPIAARFSFITDQPRDAEGKPPKLRGREVLLFARHVERSDQLTLVNPAALMLWDMEREVTARTIAAELAASPPPPAVTGIAQAFHVTGTVRGESESQIFLSTDAAIPITLTIERRADAPPQWAVAFGEIIDASARRPVPRTLRWYRLACGLPRTIPAAILRNSSAEDARAIAADYALVLGSIAPCDRTAAR